MATLLTPNSGQFGIAVGVGSAGSDQTPRVNIPYPASLGTPYDTIQLEYEITDTGKIRVMMVFFTMKMGDGLNYLDFKVFGLNTKDPDWDAKEIGRILPQTQAILNYLTPDAYTNETDHFNSRYICPEGVVDAPENLVFVTEVDPADFEEGAIPGGSSNTGMIIEAQFSM